MRSDRYVKRLSERKMNQSDNQSYTVNPISIASPDLKTFRDSRYIQNEFASITDDAGNDTSKTMILAKKNPSSKGEAAKAKRAIKPP